MTPTGPLYFCNGCRGIWNLREGEVIAYWPVRSVDMTSGEEVENELPFCPDCQKRLEKNKALYPFKSSSA